MLMERVIVLARAAFGRRPVASLEDASFSAAIDELRKAMNAITKEDLGLHRSPALAPEAVRGRDKNGVAHGSRSRAAAKPIRPKAPITYISVYTDPDFSVGVFVVAGGKRIPLHNHPRMFGLLKVVAGDVDIECYSKVLEGDPAASEVYTTRPSPDLLLGRRETLRDVSSSSDCALLTPTQLNLHEIRNSGPTSAAFLDVLAPPYSREEDHEEGERRDCFFFQPVMAAAQGSDLYWLKEVQAPKDYFCDSELYQGPTINV